MADQIASTYEIIKELGSGGGGVAYLAYHNRLRKKVVLKADKRKIQTSQDLLRKEADVLKDLNNTYIPQVYDYFIENNISYTVIDFVEGESLDIPLRKGTHFSQAKVIKWAVQILEALEYLHSPIHGNPPKGYVHSDIKPANIMLKPNGDICLIDFNIALALGDESAIGCSAGYASPEHYGMDYSVSSDSTVKRQTEKHNDNGTDIIPLARVGSPNREQHLAVNDGSSASVKKIIPDIRSDIYSLGATLYHLLSGVKPAKDAKEVVPLSKDEFSPLIVEIISKSMNLNPDLRYQSAEEMMDAFLNLRKNDARTKRWRKTSILTYAISGVLLTLGILAAFAGLKRMQTKEKWLKLASYSEDALQEGDVVQAVDYALQSLNKTSDIFQPEYIYQGQKALTDALNVYDLSDGYKAYRTIVLPTQPQFMEISPNGNTAVALCHDDFVLFDTNTGEITSVLSAQPSSLSEAHYLNEHILVYAGQEGICAYDLEMKKHLWKGDIATAICVSGDGSKVASLYKDETYANLYDSTTGELIGRFDFAGNYQYVPINDRYATPDNNLKYPMFALNQDGSMLAISFADNSMKLISIDPAIEDVVLFTEEQEYSHFEGGFYGNYYVGSATKWDESFLLVYDTALYNVHLNASSPTRFQVEVYNWGVTLRQQNALSVIDPETGVQIPLVDSEEVIRRHSSDGTHTVVAVKNNIVFFDENSKEMCRYPYKYTCDFLELADGKAVFGNRDTSLVQIMVFKDHKDADVLRYDPNYIHTEARINGDESRIMLFSILGFRIFDKEGNLVSEKNIPNIESIYDMEYRRVNGKSWLEVSYYDGEKVNYQVTDGTLMGKDHGSSKEIYEQEEFLTEDYRIRKTSFHYPEVYDRITGEFLLFWKEDAHLQYVTELEDYIIAQYISYDLSEYYGVLMDKNCTVLAKLPYLCDICNNTLYFDYPSGYIRRSPIYSMEALLQQADESF